MARPELPRPQKSKHGQCFVNEKQYVTNYQDSLILLEIKLSAIK